MHLHPFSIIVKFVETWAMQGGYTFLFIISTIEAVPLIGSTVPGHTAVVLAGFLSRIGVFNIWIVMFLASLGAILGDTIGYYIGRKYGTRFIEKYKRHFFFKEEYIEKAKRLIHEHTGKALVFGRFNPLTRPFMPLLVGASSAHPARFWFYNVVGGIFWAVSSVLVGYIFGIGYHAAVGYFGKAVLFATVIALISIWGYKFVNARFHIFRRYELFMLILNLIAIWGLFETIQDAWARHSPMAVFDVWVNVFMHEHIHGFLAYVAQAISFFGSNAILTSLSIILSLWLLRAHRLRSGAIMLLSTISVHFLTGYMKIFFMRLRPENALIDLTADPSFPSGHAAIAAAFFLVLAYLYAPKIKTLWKRELFILASVISMILIGFSRVMLNVHWVSDVIAGWSLGIFCASASVLLVRYIGALFFKRYRPF